MKDVFPILHHYLTPKHLRQPETIPWELLASHEEQALKNHNQSLQRLAERGGLSISEAVAILEDRPWHAMPDSEARYALEAYRASFTNQKES